MKVKIITLFLLATKSLVGQIYIQTNSSFYEDRSNKCIISNQDSGGVFSAPVNSGDCWLSAYTSLCDHRLVFTSMAYDGRGKVTRKCNAIMMLCGETSHADSVLIEKYGYFCGKWRITLL